MTKDEVRSLLPNVGDVRMEIPVTTGKYGIEVQPMECQVVEVNRDHMWYRVRFTDSGLTECYKLPKPKRAQLGGLPG